jgi:membrane dipeptidase
MVADRAYSRRGFTAGLGALLALGACRNPTPAAQGGAADVLGAASTVDMHSHAGNFMRRNQTFEALARSMRTGRLAVACLATVADGPLNRVVDGGRIKSVRQPEPGELSRYSRESFTRVLALAREQSLGVIKTLADLDAARTSGPAVVIAAEGGDFLEGALGRLDEFHETYGLRHLQLTHYRPNEIGDIQTEPPVHGGLSTFGADVVRGCNRLGIVIDVAHAPHDMVARVAAISDRPLVLSHTSLDRTPPAFSRRITPDHARLVAGTGGVIGVWPPRGFFPTRAAFVTGIARMVDVVGVDHVGIGTDMRGLPGGSVFDDYAELPDVAAEMLAAGFDAEAIVKILGGNYRRVFAATLTRA